MATIYEALAEVMAEVQAVKKDGRNTAQNFNFRGIDAVMNAVGPALRKHGVVIIPTLEESNYRDIEVGQKRTLMREVTVRVKYTAYGPEGDSICGVVCGESMDSGDKGTAKAFSVAYRTFLLQALTIPTDEADPDEHSYQRAARTPEPEEQPLPGWSSLKEQKLEHDDIASQIKASSEAVQAAMRKWRADEKLGWPMSNADLTRMWTAFAKATEDAEPKRIQRAAQVAAEAGLPEAEALAERAKKMAAKAAGSAPKDVALAAAGRDE